MYAARTGQWCAYGQLDVDTSARLVGKVSNSVPTNIDVDGSWRCCSYGCSVA